MKRKYDDPEERRRQERSRYIGMVRAVFKVCRRQAVPLYSSKYSRKEGLHNLAAHRAPCADADGQEVLQGVRPRLPHDHGEADLGARALQASCHTSRR
jgi:hypothetical protein